MTKQEGRGVQAWVRLTSEALSRMNRGDALQMIRELPREDRAYMMLVASDAGIAVDGDTGGNLLYEAAAEDLLGISVDEARQ